MSTVPTNPAHELPLDRDFVAAITEGREPASSVAGVLPCCEVLDRIERRLASQ